MNRLFAAASLALATSATTISASAHNKFELDAAIGYRFPFGATLAQQDVDGQEFGEGDLSFDGGLVFSGSAGYRIQHDGFIYISYTRGINGLEYDPESGSTGFDLSGSRSIEYFQFGGRVEKTEGIFVPYMGFSIGLARIAPVSGGDDRIFFSPVLDPGLKIDLHEHVHLRIMGRVPLIFSTKEVVCADLGCVYANQVKPLVHVEALGGLGVSF